MRPLVVSLEIDPGAQATFDAERARLFPTGRTEIGAHVTLFHALPGELEMQARKDLAEVAGPAFDVGVAGVLPLGRGVAYALAAPELAARHHTLQQLWWPHLTAQDRQGFRPHITVQNTVDPAEARATLAVLRRRFRPHQIRALGFALWRYDGGPWHLLDRIPFGSS